MKKFSFIQYLTLAGFLCSLFATTAIAQTEAAPVLTAGPFRIGERISYNISLDNFRNAAFFETHVISRGKIADKNVVEIESRMRTQGFVSAAIILLDERRTTFASIEDGSPVLIKRVLDGGVSQRQVDVDNTRAAGAPLDLIAALFKARASGGSGSFPFSEDGEDSTITFLPEGSGKVETGQGPFDSTIVRVTGPYFDSHGIKNVRLWLSDSEAKIPVAFEFKTRNGTFRGTLASYSVETPGAPTPTPSPTPIPVATPQKPAIRPTPSPTPYIADQPLLPELKFRLGEELTYEVTEGGRKVGSFLLAARERKLVGIYDTLVLEAKVTGVDGPNPPFSLGDSMVANVDPASLGPSSLAAKLSRSAAAYSQNATFDQRTGTVTFGPNKAEGPIGVHCVLSLVYAMRSFNLAPSREASNPVNDTRVAVFWRDKVQIFSLRPSRPETIELAGKKVEAQAITIVTHDPAIDKLGFKIWLSTGAERTPLRFATGAFQADLVSQRNVLSR
ncbi:MAG: hypothetical protein UZ17_ACD001000506 [Acidobacteria bacterium OLB17]|nr:MAG: hypothetical protein UZ17_ACD001000506 [Acidobacteria bacterium OLB17]MCZ2389452.1 DUF3108 domain-containing protein [Acidobacteriota bacterium]